MNDFDDYTAGGNDDAKQDDESKVQTQIEKVNDEKDLYNGESNKDTNKDKSRVKCCKAQIDDDSSDNE